MSPVTVSIFLLALCGSSFQWPFGQSKIRTTRIKAIPDMNPETFRREVHYYEQTVAVVDLDEGNQIRNCNVIEAYERAEAVNLLKKLSAISRPQKESFPEMITLMELCDLIDGRRIDENSVTKSDAPGNSEKRPYSSIFSGILPGTKWCGIGDLARNYFDLGQIANVDRCCRTHDLCPIKIQANKERYNLMNSAFYSKSHCDCDEILYRCLKAQEHQVAEVMGKIYFNVIKVPCIEDVPISERISKAPKFRFSGAKRNF